MITTLSPSSLTSLQTCERKFAFEYLQRLTPREPSTAMRFGSAWHAALAKLPESLEAAVTEFNAAFEDVPTDTTRTRQTAKRMLELYQQKYREQPLTIEAYERWLEVPLSEHATIIMRLDGLVRQGSELCVLERKTTGGAWGITSSYLDTFKPNNQLATYVLGAQSLDTGVSRVVVDVSWVGKLAPRSGDRFLRYEETVEPWEILEILRVYQSAFELTKHWDISWPIEAFSPNWSACHQYGGCPFRIVCKSAPSIRGRILEERFTRKEERHGSPGSEAS